MQKRFLTIGTLILTAGLAGAQTKPSGPQASAADQTLHYGSDPLQFGELRLPKSTSPVPVVIIVHGGCWTDHFPGPQEGHALPDASLTRPLASALADRGVATWNIEYRRAGSPGGGWPNTYLDLAAAVDYLRKIAPTYKLDLSSVTVIGHSSGGQLALWIGARSKLPGTSPLYTTDPLALKDIIDLDGPPELTTAQPVETQYCPIPAITQFLGGTPAEKPGRYRDGSAEAFLPLGIPQIIVTAALLQNVGTLAADYVATAKAKGDSVTLIPLESNHFAMLDPTTDPGKALIAIILAAANKK
jgi:acetyl esterase/lipase